jgi:hypothetical protein
MRSDFINKREIYQRRRQIGETGGTTTEYELILLPKFDTFIYHQTATAPTSGENWNLRWGTLLTGGGNPNASQEIPIGLLNPWNDGGPPSGQFSIAAAPRTPTRMVMAFDLSQIPAGAFILDSRLNMTVSSKAYWNSSTQPLTDENINSDIVYGTESDGALQDLLKTDVENASVSQELPSTPIPSVSTTSEAPAVVETFLEEDSPTVTNNWLLFYSSIA